MLLGRCQELISELVRHTEQAGSVQSATGSSTIMSKRDFASWVPAHPPTSFQPPCSSPSATHCSVARASGPAGSSVAQEATMHLYVNAASV